MGLTPLTFSGVSTYSADFQKILERSMTIAAQPISALQNEQTKILQRKSIASGLRNTVDGLAEAVRKLGETGNNKALGGTSTNSSKVSIGTVTATAPASYTITEITSLARSASASSNGYSSVSAQPVSATGTVRLTVGGTEQTITLNSSENNLTGLRDKINGLGLGVTASIFTTGTGANPNYLSITANTTGEKAIALVDDPTGAATNLLSNVDSGSNANFKLNGVSVSKSSNLVNDVVNGVSFTLTGTTSGSESVTLSLSSNRNSVSSRLNAFVEAYNSVLEATDAQVGEAAGLLTGDFLVRETNNVLREIAGYEGSGAIKSLSDLGISFAKDGKASFDDQVLADLSDSSFQEALNFLGTETTGFGGQVSRLKQLSEPVTGLISIQEARYEEEDAKISERVEELTARLEALQQSTSLRLQTVDALLGSLESQKTIIDASYKSVQLVLFGKNQE